MDELRNMMQTLVGAMAAQHNYYSNYYSHRNHNRQGINTRWQRKSKSGGNVRIQGEIENPAIPAKNVAVVKQFLKLKQPTFSGKMNPIKANGWLLEMEKNFRLLRCGEQYKVEIGSYLLAGPASRWWNLKGASRWWNLKGVRWGRLLQSTKEAFTNLTEYAPHLVTTDEMRARRFEDGLRYEIKRVDTAISIANIY
ncbi:hypothetical protein Acr_04g0003400 [Actinidia rufa]|uniref:Uncharacterized protein n=1 Tax=Actinidia rufa TaxID=165716 RepID=A0A7J0EH56_9ERIC|nr:hypothetical protein Acr_04g0003400 [Actinidia rufa]